MRKQFWLLLFLALCAVELSAQSTDREQIERACKDYIEGFYEGDTTKLIRSLKPFEVCGL